MHSAEDRFLLRQILLEQLDQNGIVRVNHLRNFSLHHLRDQLVRVHSARAESLSYPAAVSWWR